MNNKNTAFVEIIVVMLFLQGLKFILELILSPIIPEDLFTDKMLTMCVMLILAGSVILYARLRKTKLSVQPHKFSKHFVIFTTAHYIHTLNL